MAKRFSQVPNRFNSTCAVCGISVGAEEGFATKWPGSKSWEVTCDEHTSTDSSNVIYFYGSGKTEYRNPKGRCIDAPCCGCCTI